MTIIHHSTIPKYLKNSHSKSLTFYQIKKTKVMKKTIEIKIPYFLIGSAT